MFEAPTKRGRRAFPAVAKLALIGGALVGAMALAPVAAQQVQSLAVIANGIVTCHSTGPCAGGANSGSGSGVSASSARNNGVDSGTSNPSATRHVGRSGVFGHDDSTDNGSLNVGVAGYSGNGIGMQAVSSNGTGLQALSTNGPAVQATSTNSTALTASSTSGTAISAFSPSTGVLGGVGIGSFGGIIGVQAQSQTGDGMDAQSTSGVAVHGSSQNGLAVLAESSTSIPIYGHSLPGNTTAALELSGGTSDYHGYAIQAFNSNTGPIFYLDNAGNAQITGLMRTGGQCSTGCSRTRRVVSYAPRESMPTMEDVGEGQLVRGTARVQLDPAFANVIDRDAVYAVFVSPEGPSRGLYVTQKSPTAFTVMENPGGRSTIPFSYRVVAKPYGVAASRLPMTDMPQGPTHIPRPMRGSVVPRGGLEHNVR